MKIKYESSGWTQECLEEGITEEERERRKQAYIAFTEWKFDIKLDRENIKRNNGMRYISKLALNSLWGR